ncbi:MAG: ketopantoate reductase family protein [Deltaproteobacteria bacterium]|nr:ketopantoate reductase family protein [Deltaproteobacteria bacterium]
MTERILVAGAGALGSVFGGFLAAAGHDVTLLGRAPHMQAVAAAGLAVDGLFGARRAITVTVASEPRVLRPPFDVVLLTVKAYDTVATLAEVAPLLAGGGCLVSLQNGLGNLERVREAVGPARAVGARVIFGAEIPVPGTVRVTVCAEPVALGAVVAGDAAAAAHARCWAARIAAAGIPTEYVVDVHAHLWAKVFYNAALNPLGALFGLPYGALAADPDARAIMDDVIEEGYAVARARGVVPTASSPEAYRRIFYERLVPSTAHHRSSMLQDLERGRRTEIDAINGCLWAFGRAAGVATPVNATLTRLIRWRERLGGLQSVRARP